MPFCKADIFEVVVLSARAHAFLRRRRPVVIALLQPEKNILELIHPRIGEEECRVAVRHQRRAANAAMSLALKKLEKRLADLIPAPLQIGLVAAQFTLVCQLVVVRKRRRLDHETLAHRVQSEKGIIASARRLNQQCRSGPSVTELILECGAPAPLLSVTTKLPNYARLPFARKPSPRIVRTVRPSTY